MASASVVLTSDTSGSVTVTVPSGTAIGTTTLTLPTSGGTIQTSGSGYTTNGVAYASSTSALTTGSSLVWTGSAMGIGTSSPLAKFDVLSTYVSDATVQARIRDNTGYSLNIIGTSSGFKGLQVQDAAGAVDYTNLLLNPLGGNVFVGSSSNILSAKFLSQFNGSTSNGAVINDSNNTSASGFMAFSVSSGTYCGNITRVGSTSAVGYNSGSDERLKENIVDAPSSNINDIKVRSFNWKSDNSFQTYGLVAQELLTSAPYCVYQPTNPEDMMGVDNSKLVPMMIKSIQELSTLITAQQSTIQSLTERITALEGART